MLNWRCRWELLKCFYQGLPFAYPTESVFGIGCDPFNPEAVNRVIDLKGRSRQKGVIVCAASIDQIAPFLTDISADERRYMCQFWPGPTTFVVPLPKRHRWSWLTPGAQNTLAVRVSAHPRVQTLCQLLGPIVSTSANFSGSPPCRHAWQIRRLFPDLPCVISGKVGGACRPTRVIDLRTRQILRS